MKILVDIGYWSYNRAFILQKNRLYDAFTLIDQLYHNTDAEVIFALDSHISFRKMALGFYKTNRDIKDSTQVLLSKAAHDLVEELIDRYEDKTLCIDGLEADDVIALNATDEDWIICNDKDFLTMRSKATLSTMTWQTWDIERLKYSGLERGEKALTYQLLYGDVADHIPRLLDSSDRETGPWILSQHKPLSYAIDLFPEAWIRPNLNALMLPTPLIYDDRDPIEVALEYYNGI